MRHREKKMTEYRRLRSKIFLQSLLIVVLSFFIISGLYTNFLSGKFANWVVSVFQSVFRVKYESALQMYQYSIRNNFELIMMVAIAAMFFLLFWFYLNWFTKYFKEIDVGIDVLMKREGKKIHMSREMEPMERKLNEVKNTLEQQFQEIQTAEQKKDELIMYLAHDIRTPLTSVIGYLNLMEEMPDLSPEQREKFIQVTLEKANRLEMLVSEFFDIVRFNGKSFQLSKQKIDLYYMLLQMVEEAYPQLTGSGKEAVIEADEDIVVFGDPDKLARVFLNILKNAIAYSEPNSKIMIKAFEEGKDTIILFTNRGKTISREEQDRIFDKFYRMDGARQTRSGGSGLGLAIARDIAQLHGGDITVQSENGVTTFKIVIPSLI